MSTQDIVHHNTPKQGVSIEPVGTQPEITYHVNWPDMKHPTPQMFADIGDIQVKLACLGNHLKTESVQDEYDEAMQAVNELLSAMVDARDLSEEDAQNLHMGNLESLPEVVEKEVQQVLAGEIA